MYGVTNGVLLYRIFQCIGYQSATSQWGHDNYSSDDLSHWVTFPMAFGKCFSVIPCIIGASSDSIKIYNINSTGFEKVSYFNFQVEHSTVSRPCLWIAVGSI